MISKQRLKNQLNKRLAELKQQYRDTCNDSGLKGNKIKKTSATVIRSSLKKNICILYLIGELLEQPNNTEVYSDESIMALTKLGII